MTTGVFYVLAISAATWRTVIRVRLGQGLERDDGLLFLACICITASTVLLYIIISDFYMLEHLGTDSASALSHDDLLKNIVRHKHMTFAYVLLSESAMFAIKLSFLSFFRRLIDRLGRIIYYWRVTVSVTAATFACYESLSIISKYSQDQWKCFLILTSLKALCEKKHTPSPIKMAIINFSLFLGIGNELMSLTLLPRISAVC